MRTTMPQRGTRRKCQAEAGESAETDLAVNEHGEDADDEVAAELQDGIRTMVTCVLDPAESRNEQADIVVDSRVPHAGGHRSAGER